MSKADYYSRAAMAASQILEAFDQSAFLSRLESTSVAVSFGTDAETSREGAALLDLLVRLLSRLYPRLVLDAPGPMADQLAHLAQAINPGIELATSGEADISVVVGKAGPERPGTVIYAGCSGWSALISTETKQPVGSAENPLGAGVAACIAAANVFRFKFAGGVDALDRAIEFSAWRGPEPAIPVPPALDVTMTLVGVGAIGNAAAWSLARLPTRLDVELIDDETLELSNLQRYVLAGRAEVGELKVEVARRYFAGPRKAIAAPAKWVDFVSNRGATPRHVLVAVDSADDRRAVQAALPEFVANAWTQPGDLGISTHVFLGRGACLRCLYLPEGEVPGSDMVMADALRIPEESMRVRELLYRGAGAPKDLLDLIAARFGLVPGALDPYMTAPLQKLLAEGICGGAVLPLGMVEAPRDLHVPLAHQSALAGVLLAAAGVEQLIGSGADNSSVTRVDVMAPLDATHATQPVLKDPRGICICQDPDYQEAYRLKYSGAHSLALIGSDANRPVG
jgi:hypothetical protein